MRRAHDHLTNLDLRSASERIAHLLLEVYVRLRRRLPAEPGEIIHLPLSQGHIGQAVGLTYVHVCRTLQILREQDVVRFANHNLEIIDPPALIATAGMEHIEQPAPGIADVLLAGIGKELFVVPAKAGTYGRNRHRLSPV